MDAIRLYGYKVFLALVPGIMILIIYKFTFM